MNSVNTSQVLNSIDILKSIVIPPVAFTKAVNLGVPDWRKQLEINIDEHIADGLDIRGSLAIRSKAIDDLLIALFKFCELDTCFSGTNNNAIGLFAVGGYGREQMLPQSDVDIMLLSEVALSGTIVEKVQTFVTKLWDIGLEAGVSVRSFGDCVAEAADITVATSLLEARMLIGNDALQNAPKKIVNETWANKAFFEAKREEQIARYHKHNNTEFNLEPDIKKAPGGLRDIHHIGWICKRYFRINSLFDLVNQNFITYAEYGELIQAEDFLLTIRHYLHRTSGRAENRLLFDYQRQVATAMGFDELTDGKHHNASIEALMRMYYRKAMRISTLSEMLNAYYFENLIEPSLPDEEKHLNKTLTDEFKIKNNAIAVTNSKVFTKNPMALLDIFVHMGRENVTNVRAKTLRLIKTHAKLIDDDFRKDPVNKAKFMSILVEPNLLFERLKIMSRLGVLGNYLPAFEKIKGLMQYDLFHRYTVDAHTLLLFKFLNQTLQPSVAEKYEPVGGIYEQMERKDILHLAVLFHDIAKGRGGDHSELGAEDAFNFAKAHGLSNKDANIVAWLVHHHLLMSITSQKKDISDPDVVYEFAEKIGDLVHLNYLYVLTVVDMNATNPDIWNSWRASLMQQLYKSTRATLKAGLDLPLEKQSLVQNTVEKAKLLFTDNDDIESIEAIWEELGDEYFLRETPQDIVWHSREILAHNASGSEEPLVVVREHHELALDAVQVFVYAKDMPNLFANTVNVFNTLDLDVQDARIITATRDFALDSYVLIDRHGTLLQDESRIDMLVDKIKHSLMHVKEPKIVHKRMPRQLKHFKVPTKVQILENPQTGFHDLIIETLDQPGLLAMIACEFLRYDVEVHSARITTLGERAEDIFSISDHSDKPLPEFTLLSLKNDLINVLDANANN